MNRIKKKLNSTAGFSLAETLLAVLILLLVSVIVAQGVPAAVNVYEKVFIGANAQAVLSTTISALKDELGTAWDVDVNTPTITYFSADTGAKSRLYLDSGTGIIMIQEYAENAGLNTDEDSIGKPRPLVSDAMSTANRKKDLKVLYDDVSIDGNKVAISNLRVEHNGTVVAQFNGDLQIEVVTVKQI